MKLGELSTLAYDFDGTYIDFRLSIMDASGLVPQTAQSSSTEVLIFDSALNTDVASVTLTELGSSGTYRVRTLYSDLNRSAGDGLWTWTFANSAPDYTYKPPAVSLVLDKEVGTTNTASFAPTTTQIEVDGLSDLTANHYKDAIIRVITSNNKKEVKKVLTSTLVTSRISLTFGALSAALTNGDKIVIINE